MSEERISFEKHMATLHGSLEDAQRAQLDTMTVQVTWNLRQIRTWIQQYNYKLTQEQRDLLGEVARMDKEVADERTDFARL